MLERDAAARVAAAEATRGGGGAGARRRSASCTPASARQEAVAEAGAARAEALEAIRTRWSGVSARWSHARRRRRGYLGNRRHTRVRPNAERLEAENAETENGLASALAAARAELAETREVASTAADIARQLEEVVTEQRSLLDVAAKDREERVAQMQLLTERLVSLEREGGDARAWRLGGGGGAGGGDGPPRWLRRGARWPSARRLATRRAASWTR